MKQVKTKIDLTLYNTFLLMILANTLQAWSDDDIVMQKAYEAYQDGKFSNCIQLLEPLQNGDTEPRELRQLLSAAYHRRGENHFREGHFIKSVADFDQELELNPSYKPKHWQRGISLYYAQQYQLGREQFELHQTYNKQDVENAVWHLLCATRERGGSLSKSRKSFIPITADSRVPMNEIHALYAGTGSIDLVLKKTELTNRESAHFYADLYLGLYYDLTGDMVQALQYMKQAAENPSAQEHYMGDVARVHLKILQQSPSQPVEQKQ